MAELTHRERLQPSLLDRLTDDEPEKKKESRDRRVISPAKLRDSVRRDLGSLFNTTHMEALAPELADYDYAVTSVLNYGIPSLAGLSLAGLGLQEIERRLIGAIRRFEPRLDKGSIHVTIEKSDEMSRQSVMFMVQATLWSQPIPLQLFLRTEVDLETGAVELTDTHEGRR